MFFDGLMVSDRVIATCGLRLRRFEDERVVGLRIADSDRQFSAEQLFNLAADHFGSPAMGQRWGIGVRRCIQSQMMKDQFAHILYGRDDAWRELGRSTDAIQGGRHELGDGRELRRGRLGKRLRTFGVRQVQRLLNACRKFRKLLLQFRPFHASHGANAARIGALPFGQFDNQVVAQDSFDGAVSALGFLFPPPPKFADHSQRALRQSGNARDATPAFARVVMLDLCLPVLHLLFQPGGALQLAKATSQYFAQRFEVLHVLQGVLHLPFRQGASSPVGSRFAFAERFVKQLLHELAVGGRVLQADKRGRNLNVEQAVRTLSRCGDAIAKLFAPGMHDGVMPRRNQQFPEGSHVVHGTRIDDGQMSIRGHLNQTQIGPVAVLRDKLGIECNRRNIGEIVAEINKLLLLGNQIVLHISSIYFLEVIQCRHLSETLPRVPPRFCLAEIQN